MDSYEATKMVFSRIQNLDPENASKIMGYLLLQDQGDKEMIRLAFGPETLLQNLIFQAKSQLGFAPNSPSTFRPASLSISASRLSSGSNGFDTTNPSSPGSKSWQILSPTSNSSVSYASIVNGSYKNSSLSCCNSSNESEVQDQFSFLNDSKTDDLYDPRLDFAMSPNSAAHHLHRRSYSVPGMCFGSEDAIAEFDWKPCLYFARGFCKNGTSCKFLHGGESADGVQSAVVGSPTEFEQCQEILGLKAAQQHQLMARAYLPYNNKCMNFLLQQQIDTQRPAAAAALIPQIVGGALNAASRQIYLTFPADSTFRDEDVSNYFSIYGPVQEVRIPYQQKRMFGFVTFVYPETVKLILAKGNPHFVCDSRVLVKPYKEKGKVPDKYRKQSLQQQQIERGDFSACSSPDSREPFELHLGARMFQNTQEMLLRRKLEEEAELQQAIELQGRRIMNLQLHQQYLHGFSNGSPIPSPTLARTSNERTLIFPADGIDQQLPEEVNSGNNQNGTSNSSTEDCDYHLSLEHILPDSLFTSPKKSNGELNNALDVDEIAPIPTTTSSSNNNNNNNNNLVLPQTSTLNMTSLKSCFLHIPRFSSGHGTIGM